MLKRGCLLPHVRAHDYRPALLAASDYAIYLCHQLVPRLMVGRHRLVHYLVCNVVVAVFMQFVRQVLPKTAQMFLVLLAAPKRIGASLCTGVEVVRIHYMQVHNHLQSVLYGIPDACVQYAEHLLVARTVRVPQLFFVNRQPHMVESLSGYLLKIVGSDKLRLRNVLVVALRKPVGNVHTTAGHEITGHTHDALQDQCDKENKSEFHVYWVMLVVLI